LRPQHELTVRLATLRYLCTGQRIGWEQRCHTGNLGVKHADDETRP
jgi:hypothetical protein